MKIINLLFVILFFFNVLNAQEYMTLEVKAGKIDSLLSKTNLKSVTHLTLTGTINGWDISLLFYQNMSKLTHLDMSSVKIESCTYQNGSMTIFYPANELSSLSYVHLTSIILPSSLEVIGYSAFYECTSLKSVDIPSSVTKIKDHAFSSCKSLTSITIPPSVKFIGKNAFYGCSSLESVIIPASVDTIGELAFSQCISLTSVEIPPSVTSIEKETFQNCSSLTSVSLPPSLKSIGDNAFELCGLSYMVIPSSVDSIGVKAFANCPSLNSVEIPSSVTTIRAAAFANCKSLSTVSIPSSITSLSGETFADCISLTQVTFPISIRSIRNSAFKGCKSLTSLKLPPYIRTLGDSAFFGCNALTELTLPASVISVGSWAFYGCGNLESVIIPTSVNKIGLSAFDFCNKLSSITAKRAVPQDLKTPTFSGMDKTACLVHVPFGSDNLYAIANEWKDFTQIKANTTGFTTSAYTVRFEAVGGESKINITSNVSWTAISNQPWVKISPESGNSSAVLTITAEANDSSINRMAGITIDADEASAQVIKIVQVSDPEVVAVTAGKLSYLFTSEEKRKMTSLTLSGTLNAWDLVTIRDEMPLLTYLDLSLITMKETQGPLYYYGHIYYKDNWMPGSSVGMDNNAFYDISLNKPSLTTLKLPLTIEVIGCYAFNGCSGLTSINIPSSVKQIGCGAFANCTSLTSVVIPSTVTHMDREVFSGCTGLTEVTFEAALYWIDKETFKGCTSLTSIKFSSNLSYIDWGAFEDCTALTSISLPYTLGSISDLAFNQCTGLSSIYSYNPWPPVMEDSEALTFSGMNKSTCTVYVPYGSKYLYAGAVEWRKFKNIIESLPGITLSPGTLSVKANGGTATAIIKANVNWTATSDQPWLTVSLSSGDTTQAITFTAEENPIASGRSAKVTISAPGLPSRAFTVIQDGLMINIANKAGMLSTLLTDEELKGTTNLTISGTIDIRDFITMRDSMPLLTVLDMSKATITAYDSYPEFHPYLRNYEGRIPEAVFYMKNSLTSVLLPLSTKWIDNNAFRSCNGLTTIKIPPDVYGLLPYSFLNCNNITSIYSYAFNPPQLYSYDSFFGVDKSSCIVYVPYGCKEKYAESIDWMKFKYIIEMPQISLSDKVVTLEAEDNSSSGIQLQSGEAWTASCDKDWLTISPASGDSSQTITFTAIVNPFNSSRIANVTIIVSQVYSFAVTVTQRGIPVGLQDHLANDAQLKHYPNPFTSQLAIEASNPSLKKVTIEIYSISGEKIKTLLRAQKDAKISCTWDGRDDNGQMMPDGMYLLKVNGETRKVVKK